MAGVALSAVPEALLTVAEKTFNSQQPVLFGLSGPQLARIAREVYVHLRNNGKEALAQQAQALTDPALLVKALQLLQLRGTLANSPAGCPCCSLGPPGSATHGAPTQPQPQVVPVVVQTMPQPLPQQPVQTPQHQQQQQPYVPPQHQGLPPVLPFPPECLDQQQQQQQQEPSLSRRACVARLIFALMAAKLAKDLLASRQGATSTSSTSSSSSRSSRSRRKKATASNSGVSGLGAVSVDSLAEPLSPRSGLFAGLPRDLVMSLQRVIASAMDGASAAAGAAGYGPSKEGKSVDGREMPPLYLSPAQQGRVELTEHEKYASELIDELLRMPGGRPIESIRSDMLKETQNKQQQQQEQQEQQQQQQQEQQQQLQDNREVKTETAANSLGVVKTEEAQKGAKAAAKAAAADTQDEGAALDAAFQAFVRRAEEHQGPSPLSVEQQLRFYGLYKRATAGLCTAKQPSRFNLKQYKKWEAWKACDRMSAVEAKKEYVERAKQLEKMHARL